MSYVLSFLVPFVSLLAGVIAFFLSQPEVDDDDPAQPDHPDEFDEPHQMIIGDINEEF